MAEKNIAVPLEIERLIDSKIADAKKQIVYEVFRKIDEKNRKAISDLPKFFLRHGTSFLY